MCSSDLSRRRGLSLEIEPRLPAPAGPAGATRPAVGAQGTVWLPDGRRLVGEVDGGSGHSGKRAPELHFGLGRIAPGTPLRVDLRWRDGAGRIQSQTLRLTPGRHTLLLGAPAAAPAATVAVKPSSVTGKAG